MRSSVMRRLMRGSAIGRRRLEISRPLAWVLGVARAVAWLAVDDPVADDLCDMRACGMRRWHVPALLGVVVAVAGCAGGSTAGLSGAVGVPRVCPDQADSVGAAQRTTPALALVPRDPDAGVVCSYYASGSPGPRALRFALNHVEASTLAWMLDTGTTSPEPAVPGARCISGFDAPNAIWLRYGATVAFVSVTDCLPDAAVAERGKTRVALSEFATDALDAMTPDTPSAIVANPVPRDSTSTPNFIGDALGRAAIAVIRAGLGPEGGADEVSDPQVPLGTVIWQEPAPGAIQQRGEGSVGLDVAVRPVPACRPDQLAAVFRAGGVGTGNLFGSIALLDVSTHACALSGPMTMTGLGRNASPDTESISERLEPPVVLSPGATAAAIGEPASSLIARFGFNDDVRDDPTSPNGLCSRFHVPATWSVTIRHGRPLLAPNYDPTAIGDPGPRFYSCRGGLSTTLAEGFGLLP